MRSVSPSEIEVYLRCREEHRLAYVEGWRPKVSAPELRFGTVVHAGLARWWETRSLGAALAELRRSATEEGLDPWETVRAEVMLTGYDARWSDDGIETLLVERPFRVQRLMHAEPFALGGKIDGAGRLGERTFVVEHKTTSSPLDAGSEYFARLVIDHQVSLYAVAARELGLEPDTCLYDVLRKPDVDPKLATPPEDRRYTKEGKLYARQRETDETPDEYRARLVEKVCAEPDSYFARVQVVLIEHELRAAVEAFDEIAQEIVAAYDREGVAIRTPGACRRYGRLCDFWKTCTGGEEPTGDRFVKITRRG